MTLACSDWMEPIVWGDRFCTGGGERHTERERERGRETEGEVKKSVIESEGERTELDIHCSTQERESALLG